MEYRRLGSTGLRISRLGLGCGNFGGIGSAPAFFGMGETEAQAFDLMDRAFDAGINVFDTANAYGGGCSEAYIGRWLKMKGGAVRQQLLLSSKAFNPVGPGPNDRGLSRRHILQQVDESLARLQTDRLDMYLIHEPDPETQALDLPRAGGLRVDPDSANVYEELIVRAFRRTLRGHATECAFHLRVLLRLTAKCFVQQLTLDCYAILGID